MATITALALVIVLRVPVLQSVPDIPPMMIGMFENSSFARSDRIASPVASASEGTSERPELLA
jgi:hypothetical protein